MHEFSATLGLAGCISAAIALMAWLGDYRRTRRRDLDAVGFMPWTAIFFLGLLAACVLLGLAARAWFAP